MVRKALFNKKTLEFKVTTTNFMEFSEYFLQGKKTKASYFYHDCLHRRENSPCAGTALDNKIRYLLKSNLL